ncbi:alpha/beta hydrolase [Pontixanthobacter gangjinensis]|uniref:Alpha/beta fold hydrolase n=1 Tax=Pontixanthobacter gangjinensis TaxID=1028742 RepID=A0A6I4SNH4_9SPHN|nr:alpha/beta hydrolase [Pontixanthobacter gangjinensis]MXO56387.1 alpha/beta fold hydrolase [Pontixanthobacter gangjinensis]
MNPVDSVSAFDRRIIPAEATEGIWSAPDGHAIRRIDWPGTGDQPKGSILFLPGRGDAYEKYLESLHEWHLAGWRVTAADWRGQAGSGRLGSDEVTGHIEDFSIWVDDLAALWADWKASTPGPHFLMGHSMGGHLALRALAEGKVDPDGMALSAPMLGFTGSFLPVGVTHAAAKLMLRLGDPARQAWKWSEKPGQVPVGRMKLLTHDKDRYEDELFWRDERPELIMGPGSWKWVERAYASMRSLYQDGVLEKVTTPVLLIGTANDKLVDMDCIESAAQRLPNGELLAFGNEAEHEILREVDEVRNRAMSAIDEFLNRIAG